MESWLILVLVARSRVVGGLVLLGLWSALNRSRAVLGSNLALGVVAGCRLEGQKGFHSVCVNHGIICYFEMF